MTMNKPTTKWNLELAFHKAEEDDIALSTY